VATSRSVRQKPRGQRVITRTVLGQIFEPSPEVLGQIDPSWSMRLLVKQVRRQQGIGPYALLVTANARYAGVTQPQEIDGIINVVRVPGWSAEIVGEDGDATKTSVFGELLQALGVARSLTEVTGLCPLLLCESGLLVAVPEKRGCG